MGWLQSKPQGRATHRPKATKPRAKEKAQPTALVPDAPAAPPPPRFIDLIERLRTGKEVFSFGVKTVADLMSTEVRYLTLDDTIDQALSFFAEHGMRYVAVLDDIDHSSRDKSLANKKLVGVVSQRDILRILSSGHGTVVEDERDQKFLRHRLGQVTARNPARAAPQTPFAEAVERILEEGVPYLPVTCGERLVGSLSAHDVVRCFVDLEFLRTLRGRTAEAEPMRLVDVVRGGAQPLDLMVEKFLGTVVDIMQPGSEVKISTERPLATAVTMMEQRGLRSLLVVDARGRSKGLITDRDIMSYLPVQSPRAAAAARLENDSFRIDWADRVTTEALEAEVRLAMTACPATVEPSASIGEVAQIMCRQGLDAAVVAAGGERGTPLGIVTEADFLRALLGLMRLAGSSSPGTAPRFRP